MKNKIVLEVCTASLEDSILAGKNCADRIELNSALELGGLTPSVMLAKQVVAQVNIPVIIMIRPRPGDFVYSEAEFELIKKEVINFKNLGVAGFAFGMLDREDNLDVSRCSKIVELASGKECVFHRAFDFLPNPVASLQLLSEIGFNRVLTSGQQKFAIDGMNLIKELVEKAGDSIEILSGAGINDENIVELLNFTCCNQVHGSFSKILTNSSIKTIDCGITRSFSVLDEDRFVRVVNAVNSFNCK